MHLVLACCLLSAVPADYDLQQVVNGAIANGTKKLELPAGVIRIAKNIRIQNATDFELSGPQTTLLFSEHRTTGLSIYGCTGLELTGFTMDWDPLPFTQGSITKVDPDGKWFEFEVHAGYPDLTQDYFERHAHVFEADQPRWKRWVPDLYPRSLEVTDPRHGRLIFGGAIKFHQLLQPGDRVVLNKRVGCGIRMDNCEDVTVKGLTLLSAPGAALLGRYMRGQNTFSYDIKPGPPPPGATQPRLMSTSADGFNYAFATAGPILEGCHFSYMGDDSVNLHGACLAVVAQQSPTELLVAWPYATESLPTVMPQGSTVRRLRQVTYEVLGTSQLVSFEPLQEKTDEQQALIEEIWPRGLKGRGTIFRLVVDQPFHVERGELLDLPDNNSPGFVIRNNVFEDHRARGLRLMANHGLVEHNVIRRTQLVAISMGAEYGFWREAGWADRVVVRDNLIEDVCREWGAFNAGTTTLGAICTFANRGRIEGEPDRPGNRGIVIENNVIRGCATAGIYLNAAAEATVRGNTLEHVLYYAADETGQRSGLELQDAIDVRHAVDTKLGENTVRATGEPPVGVEVPSIGP